MTNMSNNPLKVVLIAHYYPPINSSGAKRFQYLSKYLSEFGVSVTVISTTKTGSDGDFSEVIPEGIDLFEMDNLGRLSRSNDQSGQFVPLHSSKPSLIRRIKDLVMRLFGQIPDPRLPFALSLKYRNLSPSLTRSLSDCDVIVATSPPWSMLLGGLFLKNRFSKPLVLDYRDHFSYCHEMPGNFFAKKIEAVIDKWLARSANHVVTISEPMRSYYHNFNVNCSVIPNGYDFEIMELCRGKSSSKLDRFRDDNAVIVRYMGIVSEGRIPRNVLVALDRLFDLSREKFGKIKFQFFGNGSVLQNYISNNHPRLSAAFEFFDFISYQDSLSLMLESDYLLFSETSSLANLSTQGILTTKLFEYLGTGRPIIADISKETLAGALIFDADKRNVVTTSKEEFFNFISNDDFYCYKKTEVSKIALRYTRKSQAASYKELLENLVYEK